MCTLRSLTKINYRYLTGGFIIAATLYYLYFTNSKLNDDTRPQALDSPSVFYKRKPVVTHKPADSLESTSASSERTVVSSERVTHPSVRPRYDPVKYSKIYNQLAAAEESVSNADINYLINHYHIKGSELLDRNSKLAFLKCNPDYTKYTNQGGFGKFLTVTPKSHGNCHKFSDMRFMNSSKVIMLVSFPGSGNTWVRMILEQATGIFTGSIFCDRGLRSNGFYGEQIISSNVLAIKTHYPRNGNPSIGHYHPTHVDGVIFIMRNPLDSIVAERKRQVTQPTGEQHTMDVDQKQFGNNYKWKGFVNVVMKQAFPDLIRYWLDEVDMPAVVIKYEDMLTDLGTQVKKMLDFLQVPYSKEDIDCVTNNNFNTYRRIHKSNFDPYTPELRKLVINGLKKVEPILNKHGVSYKNVIEQNNG